MSKARLLIVDDELSMREFLKILFLKEGYEVVTAESGAGALKEMADTQFDLVITDLKMPGISGIEVLRAAKKRDPEIPVVIITAYANPESVSEALDLGVADYVNKPFRVDDLKHVIESSLKKQDLVRENIQLRVELGSRHGFGNIFGAHPRMREVYELIKRVSPSKSNIIILGETGTGKELVAKAIHFDSPRSGGPFIVVNCGAIPETLWESEMFGHKRGAFTGAIAEKTGLFQLANKGTIFLDEVGEMPPSIQVKILRAIQEREVLRIGGTVPETVDVRIIAATNRNLDEEVEKGNFREDLFYRLNVIAIHLPPLRERASDVPMLANFFLEKFATEVGKNIRKISEETMELLGFYQYPGTVRELENIIERAVTLEQTNIIHKDSLPPRVIPRKKGAIPSTGLPAGLEDEGIDLERHLGEMEKEWLLWALQQTGGVKKKAAKLLKISFRSFRYRLKKYGYDVNFGEDSESEN